MKKKTQENWPKEEECKIRDEYSQRLWTQGIQKVLRVRQNHL